MKRFCPSPFPYSKRFELLRRVGDSYNGEIYKAYDRSKDKFVILKYISFETRPSLLQDITFVKRWQRMCRFGGKLHHRNIPRFIKGGVLHRDGVLFYSREFISGFPLSAEAALSGMRLPAKVKIAYDLSSALAYAHANRVIHRDIKPSNIILSFAGIPYLTDFASARFEDAVITRPGFTLGTPKYMSPEQVRGEHTDARSDIFSLGIVFYYIFTGEEPFRGENAANIEYKIVHEAPSFPGRINQAIPEQISHLILRMLKKSPAERPRNLHEVMKELEPVLEKFRS